MPRYGVEMTESAQVAHKFLKKLSSNIFSLSFIKMCVDVYK